MIAFFPHHDFCIGSPLPPGYLDTHPSRLLHISPYGLLLLFFFFPPQCATPSLHSVAQVAPSFRLGASRANQPIWFYESLDPPNAYIPPSQKHAIDFLLSSFLVNL